MDDRKNNFKTPSKQEIKILTAYIAKRQKEKSTIAKLTRVKDTVDERYDTAIKHRNLDVLIDKKKYNIEKNYYGTPRKLSHNYTIPKEELAYIRNLPALKENASEIDRHWLVITDTLHSDPLTYFKRQQEDALHDIVELAEKFHIEIDKIEPIKIALRNGTVNEVVLDNAIKQLYQELSGEHISKVPSFHELQSMDKANILNTTYKEHVYLALEKYMWAKKSEKALQEARNAVDDVVKKEKLEQFYNLQHDTYKQYKETTKLFNYAYATLHIPTTLATQEKLGEDIILAQSVLNRTRKYSEQDATLGGLHIVTSSFTTFTRKDEQLQRNIQAITTSTMQEYGSLIMSLTILNLPALAGYSEVSEELRTLLDNVYIQTKNMNVNEAQHFIDTFITTHPEEAKQIASFVEKNTPQLLRQQPVLKEMLVRSVLSQLQAQGINTKGKEAYIEKEVLKNINSSFRFDIYVMKPLAHTMVFFEEVSDAPMTKQIQILTRQVLLPFLAIAGSELMAVANKIGTSSTFQALMQKLPWAKSMGEKVTLLVSQANNIYKNFSTLYLSNLQHIYNIGNKWMQGGKNVMSFLDKLSRPGDMLAELGRNLMQNITKKAINTMAHLAAQVAQFLAHILAQVAASVMSYFAVPIAIVGVVILLFFLFLVPTKIPTSTARNQALMFDQIPAIVAMQNTAFSFIGDSNDILASQAMVVSSGDKDAIAEFNNTVARVQSDIKGWNTRIFDTYTVNKLLDTTIKIPGGQSIYAVKVDDKLYNVWEQYTTLIGCIKNADETWTSTVISGPALSYIESTSTPMPVMVTCSIAGAGTHTQITYGSMYKAYKVNLLERPMKNTDDTAHTDMEDMVAYGPSTTTYFATLNEESKKDRYVWQHTSILDPRFTQMLYNMKYIKPGTATKDIIDTLTSNVEVEKNKAFVNYISEHGKVSLAYVSSNTPILWVPYTPTVGEFKNYYQQYYIDNAYTSIAKQFTDNTLVFRCDTVEGTQWDPRDPESLEQDIANQIYNTNAVLCVDKVVNTVTINIAKFGATEWSYTLPVDTGTTIEEDSTVTIGGNLARNYLALTLRNNKDIVATLYLNEDMVDMKHWIEQPKNFHSNIVVPLNPYAHTTLFEIYVSDNKHVWSHIAAADVPLFTSDTSGNYDSLLFMYWKAQQ